MNSHERDKKAYLNATPMQRDVVRRLLCDLLACLRAQYLSYQTSHWQVVGGSFYGNHLLFERLYQSVQEQVDQLAEKTAGYLGAEVLGLDHQMDHMMAYTEKWSLVSCNHRRGLQSEADLQRAIRAAYEGIKQAKAMTLGLDDWLMATANAHDENEYLLQQALAQPPVAKQASVPTPPYHGNREEKLLDSTPQHALWQTKYGSKKYWMITDYDGQMVDPYGTGFGKKRAAMEAWEVVSKGKLASGGDEDYFYKDPAKREVLEFAESNAISNSVAVVENAAEHDHLDIPESKAIEEALEAPPLPTEIAKEPGGAALSTLNRYVIDSEDKGAAKGVPMNEARMARWLGELGG